MVIYLNWLLISRFFVGYKFSILNKSEYKISYDKIIVNAKYVIINQYFIINNNK